MSKLLAHFKAMQDKAADYIEPGPYVALDKASAGATDHHAQDRLFAHDMVYMLDGPEQRAAQAEAEFDYIAEAKLTLSNSFHGGKATLAEARKIMADFIQAGQRLDALKKALFYGKGDDLGLTASPGAELMSHAPAMMAGGHDPGLAEWQRNVVILHCLIGIATEGVEGIEALFKSIWGKERVDLYNVLEESGDGFWYHANLFGVLGSDFPTEQRRNIAKLRERFPNNFTEYDAINRNLTAERVVLEADHGVDVIYADGKFTDERTAALYEPLTGDQGQDSLTSTVGNEGVLESPPERFHTRCPDCHLTNHQHRQDCQRGRSADPALTGDDPT